MLYQDSFSRRVSWLVLGGACACFSACLVTFDDWPLRGGSSGQSGLGGGSPDGVSGGSSATGGTAASGSGGSPSGGAPGGGSPSGGSTSGGNGGAAGLVSGTNWLTFNEDWADPADGANGALNISGSVYAYGDGCATLTWDKATRCASGVLCEPGPTYQNWGIAIGFDFYNTGESGSPANAKLTWNPEDVDAIGVAWNITGTAPGLQVWVLNMDPTWNGVCTAATCDIAGPPDGEPVAGSNGALYFATMDKDVWAGGVDYTWNPAATDSLQFKLAAIRAGAQSFAFCLDRLGIIFP